MTSRLRLLVLLALPLAACGKDAPSPSPPSPAPTPSPDRQALIVPGLSVPASSTPDTPSADAAAPASAPASASASAPVSAPASASASAPVSASASASAAPEKKSFSPTAGLPRAPGGVFPPGAADRVLKLGDAPIVKVLDAGAEPREAIAYALTKGASQKARMAMDLGLRVTVGGRSLPRADVPTMAMLLEMSASDKNAAGDFRIDAKVEKMTVEPKGAEQEQIAAAMRPQLDAVKGFGMGYWLTPRGHVHDVKVSGAEGAVPQGAQQVLAGLSQALESILAPLPDAPVGAGAKWQVVTRVASAGADLIQASVYTLKERSGTRITLDVELVQLAASDQLKAPDLPPGVTARLRSFKSGGGGTAKLDTTSLAPDSAATALKTTMKISAEAPGSPPEESTIETTTRIKIGRP